MTHLSLNFAIFLEFPNEQQSWAFNTNSFKEKIFNLYIEVYVNRRSNSLLLMISIKNPALFFIFPTSFPHVPTLSEYYTHVLYPSAYSNKHLSIQTPTGYGYPRSRLTRRPRPRLRDCRGGLCVVWPGNMCRVVCFLCARVHHVQDWPRGLYLCILK